MAPQRRLYSWFPCIWYRISTTVWLLQQRIPIEPTAIHPHRGLVGPSQRESVVVRDRGGPAKQIPPTLWLVILPMQERKHWSEDRKLLTSTPPFALLYLWGAPFCKREWKLDARLGLEKRLARQSTTRERESATAISARRTRRAFEYFWHKFWLFNQIYYWNSFGFITVWLIISINKTFVWMLSSESESETERRWERVMFSVGLYLFEFFIRSSANLQCNTIKVLPFFPPSPTRWWR